VRDIITYNHHLEQDEGLPIRFFTACTYHSQERICRPEGSSVFHQIMIVVSGTGLLKCQSRTYDLKSGCAFFTAKGTPVEYSSTENLVTAFLTADGPAVEGLMAHYDCDGFLFLEEVNREKYLLDIDRVIKGCRAHRPSGVLSAQTYSLYADFFSQQSDPATPLEQVVRYMENHFMRKLTLSQLADIGCMSVSKLCHDFKCKYGVSVFTHILSLRLAYARTLLTTDGGQTVKAVAAACGFEDVSYFCRAYKRKFGRSPAKERSL
jgi:AraC-like DNA-binding protein